MFAGGPVRSSCEIPAFWGGGWSEGTGSLEIDVFRTTGRCLVGSEKDVCQSLKRASRLLFPVVERPSEMAKSYHRWVDELLRSVLPFRNGSTSAACQFLLETLGWEEIQTVTDLQTVQKVVDWGTQPRTQSVR